MVPAMKKASNQPSEAQPSSAHLNSHLLPNGAYVTLSKLQQLRHFAQQCTSSKKTTSKAMLSGHHKSRAVSRGMEFEEVRQYQPGDDIRSIDWRVTARTQITHSKRYSEEKEKPVITAVDQRRSLFFGSKACFKSVYACHLAAIINWATLSNGDRSGGSVLTNSGIDETRPVRSHRTVNQWLQQLTTANKQLTIKPQQEPTLATFLQQLVRTTPTGSHLYIISDFYDLDEQCEQWLFQLSRHHTISLLWVVDALEEKLPNTPSLMISNGQSSTRLSLQQQAQHDFQQHTIAKENKLKALTQQLRLSFHKAPLEEPPISVIQSSFH